MIFGNRSRAAVNTPHSNRRARHGDTRTSRQRLEGGGVKHRFRQPDVLDVGVDGGFTLPWQDHESYAAGCWTPRASSRIVNNIILTPVWELVLLVM